DNRCAPREFLTGGRRCFVDNRGNIDGLGRRCARCCSRRGACLRGAVTEYCTHDASKNTHDTSSTVCFKCSCVTAMLYFGGVEYTSGCPPDGKNCARICVCSCCHVAVIATSYRKKPSYRQQPL